MRPAVLVTLVSVVVAVGACSRIADSPSGAALSPVHRQDRPPGHATVAGPPALDALEPADFPGLHNVVTYAPQMFSGSVPEGAAGFDTLASWGIRTVISVDGARPDLAAAKARGMRYVHLPIGYNGMTRERTLELARALRDLPGPTYLHCHHGRHRSAGALGSAVVTLGLADTEFAVARMKVSGTSPSYPGLYRCVQTSSSVPAAVIDLASAEFPETWQTSDMVSAMVAVDEAYELMRKVEKAGWAVPPSHPDVVPAAEAGRLADLMRVLIEDKETRKHPPDFADMLRESASAASAIEEALIGGGVAREPLSVQFDRITTLCKDCHIKYRN
ncbi:MAG: hypothetical protein HRU75_03635 [Planctomycetia bacterium]|nr:MAG: hypothetical protein HRU75_03635 [Planctomycetia bacterium]